MSTKDDCGPAFPVGDLLNGHTDGMSLRDWFAGMALQGLIVGCLTGDVAGFTVEGNSVAAYEYADAMIEARKK